MAEGRFVSYLRVSTDKQSVGPEVQRMMIQEAANRMGKPVSAWFQDAPTVNPDGTVAANYSNGLTQNVFRIPLATFPNPDGLSLVQGNAYAQSGSSGTPVINPADTAGSGTVQAYALEGSTVDLATEFTNMITTQQAYSASARVVSTASQMLDELMQIQH